MLCLKGSQQPTLTRRIAQRRGRQVSVRAWVCYARRKEHELLTPSTFTPYLRATRRVPLLLRLVWHTEGGEGAGTRSLLAGYPCLGPLVAAENPAHTIP
jgi:hypothetical protein